jgi:predicted acetyltransferase
MTDSSTSLNVARHDDVLDLLVTAFDDPKLREFFRRHQIEDPAWRPTQQRVLEVDGVPLAHLWVAHRTMRYGVARIPFGGIADVATHPDHRGRGYCGRLLDDAIAYMAEQDLPLSVLFSGTPNVYRGRGWLPISSDWIEASLAAAPVAESTGYVVRPFEGADLDDVMGTYEEVSSELVGPLERSQAYWSALQQWLPAKPDSTEFFFDVLFHVRSLVGYAITRMRGDEMEIMDAGIQYEALGLPMLRHWQQRAQERGVSAITGRLHHSHPVFSLLAKHAGGRLVRRDDVMLRLNSVPGVLAAITPELERRRRRASPLAGPTFVLAVGDERVRIESPIAKVVLGEPQGDEPVLKFTPQDFLHVLTGHDGGIEAIRAQDAPAQVKVFAASLFPNKGYQYWLADLF